MPLTKNEPTTIKTSSNEDLGNRRGARVGPIFPRYSLKRTLAIAEAIEKNNAGRPYDRLDLAKALDWSPNSSGFRILIIASGRYGLTEGGYSADKISLTPLGSSIVAPVDENQAAKGIKQALLAPEVFRKVLEFYNNKAIPKEEFFKSSLKKQFGVSPEDVDVCYTILMSNLKDYKLVQNIKGNDFLQLGKLESVQVSASQASVETTEIVSDEEMKGATEPETISLSPPAESKPQLQTPRVFISHSKSKMIVDQIKEMLEFAKFDSEVAEERETLAIPISEKVFGLMEKCNCAIINISADEEKKQADNTYSINENVLTEIGAAYLHYRRRVILLIDNRLRDKLPSNIKQLAAIFYEGTELPWSAASRLQKTLGEFRDALSSPAN